MKYVKITFILLILNINSTVMLGQTKYNKIKNTPEICSTMKIINDYLINHYNDEDYIYTGIAAYGQYNNIGIVYESLTRKFNNDQLFEDIYNILKEQNIDYKNIRYLIITDFVPGLVGGVMNQYAIIVSGEDLFNNREDFTQLKNSIIIIKNIRESVDDPDIPKIIKSFLRYAQFIKNWTRTTTNIHTIRNKTILRQHKGCIKGVEKGKW